MRTRLRQVREAKGLSVSEAAEIFRISPSFYYKIENGARNPGIELAKKIADFYEKGIDELFFNIKMDETSSQSA